MTDKYAMRGPPRANEKVPAGIEVFRGRVKTAVTNHTVPLLKGNVTGDRVRDETKKIATSH